MKVITLTFHVKIHDVWMTSAYSLNQRNQYINSTWLVSTAITLCSRNSPGSNMRGHSEPVLLWYWIFLLSMVIIVVLIRPRFIKSDEHSRLALLLFSDHHGSLSIDLQQPSLPLLVPCSWVYVQHPHRTSC